MDFLNIILNILTSGLPCCLLAVGIFITYRLLDFAVRHNVERFIYASSVEIYGENVGDVEKFSEDFFSLHPTNVNAAINGNMIFLKFINLPPFVTRTKQIAIIKPLYAHKCNINNI